MIEGTDGRKEIYIVEEIKNKVRLKSITHQRPQ